MEKNERTDNSMRKITEIIRDIPYHIVEFPSRVKYFIQRGRRGWSDQDAWAIDYWLVETLIPMLERMRKNRFGTPASMYRRKDGVDKDGYPTDEASKMADQRWYNVLSEIIYGLKCAKEIQITDYDELTHGHKEMEKRLTIACKRSFTLIGRYLFTLWD